MGDKLKFPSGVIQGGQYRPVIGERSATTSKIGRDPRRLKNNLGTVPTAFGMTRQTVGKLHPHLHSRPIDDVARDKLCCDAKSVPVHDGMSTDIKSASTRGLVRDVGDASKHLRQAGRHNFSERQSSGHDDTLIGHRVFKGVSLTPLPRKNRDR